MEHTGRGTCPSRGPLDTGVWSITGCQGTWLVAPMGGGVGLGWGWGETLLVQVTKKPQTFVGWEHGVPEGAPSPAPQQPR